MSSMNPFSYVRFPFLMISNKDFQFISSFTVSFGFRYTFSKYVAEVYVASNKSLNAIISADSTDLFTPLAL